MRLEIEILVTRAKFSITITYVDNTPHHTHVQLRHSLPRD